MKIWPSNQHHPYNDDLKIINKNHIEGTASNNVKVIYTREV
jgi:hypothetical protein